MGISRLSAMIIQNQPDENLLVDAMQVGNGLWMGWLYLLKNGEVHQPIINGEPIHSTACKAEDSIKAVIKAIRDLGDKIYQPTREAAEAAGGGE